MDENHSIVEIAVPRIWVGKRLRDVRLRTEHHLNLLTIRRGEAQTCLLYTSWRPVLTRRFLPPFFGSRMPEHAPVFQPFCKKPEQNHIKPVSYTHLDVYKRQD